jgi:hypothetical protein
VRNGRERLIFHGAIVLFVGLLCGVPAAAEADGAFQGWRAAHLGLITTGIWLLAMSTVLSALLLRTREAAGLVWSLLVMGYGLMVGLLIGAMIGVRAISPAAAPVQMIAFAGNAIGVLAALLAALLTIQGARAAVRRGSLTDR